jgi:hypothetical protein
MRLILGMMLGAILTVTAAYLHDSLRASPATDPAASASRAMVNWDVVESNWNSFKAKAHAGWTDLKARVERS